MGASAYASMWPGSRIYGRAFIAPVLPADGVLEIALTFDDGPNPECTLKLLELLARYEVRASFFMIGRYAAAERALVREVHSAGHLIGNHTWTHPNLAVTGSRRTREELSRTSGELEAITGAPVRYFRPPFGARRPATLRIARELGMLPVLWNAIGNDWDALSAEAITTRATRLIDKNERRGYATNLVLHDGGHLDPRADRSRTLVATGALLAGFGPRRRFVTLDQWRGVG